MCDTGACCIDVVCTDDDGIVGICSAMNMVCDPDPYGLGDPYCINTNGCPVPGTNNGTSTCGPGTTMNIINEPQGVTGDQWCPGPYRF